VRERRARLPRNNNIHGSPSALGCHALPFALIQPILGPLADAFGKTRIMTGCLLVLIATAAIGATATSFPVLLASRMLAGVAAGGIFPVSLAIVGDLVPVAERQIALGRYLAVVISGNFLGGSLGMPPKRRTSLPAWDSCKLRPSMT